MISFPLDIYGWNGDAKWICGQDEREWPSRYRWNNWPGCVQLKAIEDTSTIWFDYVHNRVRDVFLGRARQIWYQSWVLTAPCVPRSHVSNPKSHKNARRSLHTRRYYSILITTPLYSRSISFGRSRVSQSFTLLPLTAQSLA